ncbi:hypothetical protein M9H77_32737 [Catharanthus roseus]|uniref:Uncharacterized protein n=1 Tax=Catharanthus roseus TaxID=4058 RepID=A0ACC0A5M1_CATRO|nr:hypothetical protein M9H77_32737 [Catharanthus roseus]
MQSGMNGSNSNISDASGRALPTSFPAQSGSTVAVLNHSGNVQGLHGIHGNYNMSNMTGSFAARNSSVIGGPAGGIQQVSGSAASGRYAVNNLPAGFSQISLAGSHGHSGVTNSGGTAGRIANPMANFIGGSNIPRNLNSGGGSNLAGAGSRLNLTGQQVIQILNNSYSSAGVPHSHNQYQAGSGPYTSLLLNEMNAHEDATIDINEFPQLGGRPTSSGSSQGQIGYMRKQNLGFPQQNQEFSIQNEDFPALPGYKGGSTEFPMNMHQKEQLHDGMSSMMQSQHLHFGRSTGVGFGAASSSHYQQHQQHATSLNSTGVPFVPANYQDVHFHDPDVRSIAQPTSASVAANLSNAVPGMGMYDQLPQQQQYQQFQKQSFFHLSSPFRDFDVRPMYAAQAADRYGMRGLLNVLKFPNPATTSLALGTDLTTLGLNLNSPEPVHKMFASPWSEEPAKEEPEFLVPDCYKAKLPPPLKQYYFSRFRAETLFYVFYSMPKDEAQLYAANELHNRGWFYHKGYRAWFTRVKNVEPLVRTNTYEKGCYFCFDPNCWETVRKDNFVMQYEFIERRPLLPQ